MLEYEEWCGGKPSGVISQTKPHWLQVKFNGPWAPVRSKCFTTWAHNGDMEATRRSAEEYRYQVSKECGKLHNRWRRVRETETGETHIEAELTQGKFTLVDECDLGLIEAHRWSAVRIDDERWYAVGHAYVDGKWNSVRLHRCILTGATTIDHISGDGLDNRRSNLRSVTLEGNARNHRIHKTNKTGVNGVGEQVGRYVVLWREDGKQHKRSFTFSKFASKEEALRAAADFRRSIDTRLGYTIRPRKRAREEDAALPDAPLAKKPRVTKETKTDM